MAHLFRNAGRFLFLDLPGRWTSPALALLLAYCAVFIAIIQNPGNHIASIIAITLCFFAYSVYIIVVLIDLRRNFHTRKEYFSDGKGRNTATTMIIVILTLPVITGVYFGRLEGPLNKVVLEATQDVMPSLTFPAIALYQNINWSAQANLLEEVKCFKGLFNESAPHCSSLDPNDPAQSCDCSEYWTEKVQEGYSWLGRTYRHREFHPPPHFNSTVPSHPLLLQTFFDFNSQQSASDSSQVQNPSLGLVIYDRDLSAESALQMGLATMINIDANAYVFVNLESVSRRPLNAKSAYEYSQYITKPPNDFEEEEKKSVLKVIPVVSVSTVPNNGLPCDRSPEGDFSWPCHVTINIQFPSFQQRIMTERMEMYPIDAWAVIGSIFACIQLLSWVFSGQAHGY